MLTTQAKYQDPFELISFSKYAAQLVQFSMVEQQVQSNEILAHLTEQLGGSNLAGMANCSAGRRAQRPLPILMAHRSQLRHPSRSE